METVHSDTVTDVTVSAALQLP